MVETNNDLIESVYGADCGRNHKYKNCISLGCFCGTASSMSRYGLRSHSGPFDWFWSDLESVLKLMETDFSDFMKRDHLFADAAAPLAFYDRKYGFWCNHDIEHDFETEYEKIYQKYMRRADWFMQAVREPTCFIRAVRSEQEVSYIEENRQYIYDVVKKDNAGNEIIFLIFKTMNGLPGDFLWFRLDIGQEDVSGLYKMRTMFDASERFSEYCKYDILPNNILEENKRFDRGHLHIAKKISILIGHLDNYDVVSVLKNYYSDIDEGIYLFGAGEYGELFSKYLAAQKVSVKGIIDNSRDKQGRLCGGIPIIPISQIMYGHQNICITVSDKFTDEIEKQILNQYPDARILSLRKIVALLEKKTEYVF